jgi:ABC-type phosphate transport system auxiliary subunit
MPVTAKLSQKFYQRLGDDIATELVEWFNAVDATYRSDVRAIADAQSARIDAQMGQMRAELRQEIAGLGAELRQEIGESRSALHQEIGELRTETRAGFADLKAELLRWMFLFWVGTMGTVLALLKL